VRWGLVWVGLLAAAPASAEQTDLYSRLWPQTPIGRGRSTEDQILDSMTKLGNELGYHLDVLTHDMLVMKVDARKQRATLAVGGGSDRFLSFKLANDIEFTDGLARVSTKVDLTFHGKKLELQLPQMEVEPASYHGERGVEIRMPLYKRRF
jgi:hypothetical protein